MVEIISEKEWHSRIFYQHTYEVMSIFYDKGATVVIENGSGRMLCATAFRKGRKIFIKLEEI